MGLQAHVPRGRRPNTRRCRSGGSFPPMIETQIRTLLDAPAYGAGAPPLSRVEDTLTAGYAHALALEAERRRLERRMADAAAQLEDDDTPLRASELGKLARSLKSASGDLSNLRLLLSSLRERANEIRAAVA